MGYEFFTCDVFTEIRFGGNQLAVITDATGLSTEKMQAVAKEFNYSETTFVFPSESGNPKVRIFTANEEIPFAGHPTLGTAFVLAYVQKRLKNSDQTSFVLEENAGPVAVDVCKKDSGVYCELKAPERLQTGDTLSVEAVAMALNVDPTQIATTYHEPLVASVGLEFLFVEISDIETLYNLTLDVSTFDVIADAGTNFVHLYVRSDDEYDIHSRMLAPFDPVSDDPATGSSNCALGGLLASLDGKTDGDFSYLISQGSRVGRPSVLHARARKVSGEVATTWIGGTSVMVTSGSIEV